MEISSRDFVCLGFDAGYALKQEMQPSHGDRLSFFLECARRLLIDIRGRYDLASGQKPALNGVQHLFSALDLYQNIRRATAELHFSTKRQVSHLCA